MKDGLTDIHEDTQIYICDINPNMLSVGKKRAVERGINLNFFNQTFSLDFKKNGFLFFFSLTLFLVCRAWWRSFPCLGWGRCRIFEFWRWINGWLHHCIWHQKCYPHRAIPLRSLQVNFFNIFWTLCLVILAYWCMPGSVLSSDRIQYISAVMIS